MQEASSIVDAVFSYLRQHPNELLRALRNAALLRFGVPIPALRWIIGRTRARKGPTDLEVSAVPPGIRVAASFDLMGTPLRASADVFVESVSLGKDKLRFDIRLAEVRLKVLDDRVESPLAALLKSGALDLSKPGNLVAYMPKRPAVLIEARDDRISIDLMRLPLFKKDPRLQRLVSVILPFLTVSAIETEGDHLDIALRAFPDGVGQAIDEVRRAL